MNDILRDIYFWHFKGARWQQQKDFFGFCFKGIVPSLNASQFFWVWEGRLSRKPKTIKYKD